MTYEQFDEAIRESLPLGLVLENPGRGSSTIVRCTATHITYLRGKCSICVNIRNLYEAYWRFVGTTVKTSDLKRFAPAVFDSSANGHNCNATFLLMVLKEIGLASAIEGSGRRGDPFFASVAER